MVSFTDDSQVAPIRGRPTIFGNVYEKNTVFLIDTSGSMYHSLDIVREHLVEMLFSRATSGRDTMFNIIEFNEEVNQWADRMVQCSPRTVSLASEWIRKLRCGTSTNTMEALLQAYEDDGMDAIYIVTDGLPDQRPAIILENVHRLHKGRPIHAIYLSGTHSDPAAMEFLGDLARETKGSLHTISLTEFGRIQKVTPVFNQKTEFLRNYDGELLSMNVTPAMNSFNGLQKPSIDSINYVNLERPMSSPPASGFVPRMYDPNNTVTILRAPHGPIPIPYVSWSKYNYPIGHSKVLDYADSVLASRGLAQFVDRAVTSVPVAASIMKGMRVLARRETDGLYYMATIKEQGEKEKFIIDFHKCPALNKPHIQEIAIYDLIAYKDAIRHHVCIGDKVLAPWQPDGRYGPGTVIDGVDRRDPQPPGYEEGGKLLITFYNGETVEVQPGVAVRVPQTVFDRLITELLLPESQRRRMRLVSETVTPQYDGKAPPVNTTWQRPFSPPRTKKATAAHHDAVLKSKIESQLDRNRHLLDRVNLEEIIQASGSAHIFVGEREKSVQFKESMDSGLCVDLDDMSEDEDIVDKEMATIDVGVGTESDFKKYVGRSVPIGIPLSKSGGKPEQKKRWRSWSSGVPPRPPRFRETTMSKPLDARDDKPPRPCHQEYQTVAGVPFPTGTDKKLALERWHPHHGFTARPAAASDPQLKHHEYQSSKGVPFPAATDRKFASESNPNWNPEQTGGNGQRPRTSWEDGFGYGDREKNMREKQRIDRKRHVAEQYEYRLQHDSANKEMKESARLSNHRKNIERRNQQICENTVAKEKQESSRMDFKKRSTQEVHRKEGERQEKDENWKHDRIDAMKKRSLQHDNMERSFEKAAQDNQEQRQTGFKEREQKRIYVHHDRLVSERRLEEGREQRLVEQERSRQNKLDSVKRDADRSKEMRVYIKKQNEEKYRASVVP